MEKADDRQESRPEMSGRGEIPTIDPHRYKTITDSVPQLIWENSPVGDAVYFNKRWFDYSGLTYEDSLGVGWVAMAHPDDDYAISRWKDSLGEGKLFESEVRLRRYDGTYLWHLLRNIPLKNDKNQIIGWFGTATDIDEHKQTTTLFHEMSIRLRAILEAAIDFSVITLDNNGIIVDLNTGAEHMFGYSKAEAIGKHMRLLFTPEDIEAGIPEVEIQNADQNGHALDERWHVRKDNSRFFMSGVMKPIRHSLLSGYVKITRDITDRKLAEEALLLSEQHKNLAVQSAQMGEWSYDVIIDSIIGDEQARHWIATDNNDSACSSADFFAMIHQDDRASVSSALQNALNGINIFHSEFRVKHQQIRDIRWVSVYGRVVAFIENKPAKLIGVIYDITTRKLLEKQKDDFISIASHELKSPVTSIRAYSELLEDAFLEEGDHQNASLVKKLNSQVDRLVRLIHNLLDASTLSELTLRLKPERFDINKLIEEEIASLELSGAKSRIVFRPEPIPNLSADPERIGQVIKNLVTNALKYSTEDKEVIISTKDMLDAVKVTVRDFGRGIPADAQPYVFDRYYRVYDETTVFNQGLGLGLYITSEIIKQHFGTLALESQLNEGSTFYFTLPYS